MRSASFITVGALLLAQQASCVRVEFEGAQADSDNVARQALRVSGGDSVVLCPLSATMNQAGNITVVWSGYPPSDDRLQLMHAVVSSSPEGQLLQGPRSIAVLEHELAGLELERTDSGIQVQALEEAASEILSLHLSERGELTQTSQYRFASEARVQASCEATVFTAEGRTTVFRSQVDGELPLFAQGFAY